MTTKHGNSGAWYDPRKGCEFRVWAPYRKQVAVELLSTQVERQVLSLEKTVGGYWHLRTAAAQPGTQYFFQLDEEESRPDPASFLQPQGVHGPSQVVDHTAFQWEDDHWQNLPFPKYVLYELHVGTFSESGTFSGVQERIPYLKNLGVTAIELMPVAAFPGERNWGYDGVYPFAAHAAYGGVEGLKTFVNACHQQGLAVVLDVVYNHLGPEGNYLSRFGPYFTEKYHTPWGSAVNFDDQDAEGVRAYFIQNALYWLEHCHVDALRLDAIHGIYDHSPKHILRELQEEVEGLGQRLGRPFHLIAESDLNEAQVIRTAEEQGYGLRAQWADDFHHALHGILTGEQEGYYQDFGRIEHLVKSLRQGFVFTGEYSRFRGRTHGTPTTGLPADRFVVFSQNHDQVGNRMQGERLSVLTNFEAAKLAAAATLLSPFVPLIFMGEEYAEERPFLYFVSHTDEALIAAVRSGRREEFASFRWQGEPPDPQASETYIRSKCDWQKLALAKHKSMLKYYQALLRLRSQVLALTDGQGAVEKVWHDAGILIIQYRKQQDQFWLIGHMAAKGSLSWVWPFTKARQILDSAATAWVGPGSRAPQQIGPREEILLQPYQAVVYQSEDQE